MEDWELIIKYLKDEISEEERKTIEHWLNADAKNLLLFNEIKYTWNVSGSQHQPIKINKLKAWESIQQKIHVEEKVIPLTTKKSNYNTWILRVAAILVVGLFATWLALKLNSKPELIMVSTTSDQKMIVMPDGTNIILNKNSILSYSTEFDTDERKVILNGEAFFDVTKNPQKPFIIENKNFQVKVLGTSFDVMAYNSDEEAVVTVVTGKVAFSDKKGNSVLLVKDEVGKLNKTNQQLTKINNLNSNFLSWKTKKLEFNNATVYDVCESLKNYFSVQINVSDKSIYNCKFTGSYSNPKLEEVLKTLEITLNLKIAINGNQLVFSGKGC